MTFQCFLALLKIRRRVRNALLVLDPDPGKCEIYILLDGEERWERRKLCKLACSSGSNWTPRRTFSTNSLSRYPRR